MLTTTSDPETPVKVIHSNNIVSTMHFVMEGEQSAFETNGKTETISLYVRV